MKKILFLITMLTVAPLFAADLMFDGFSYPDGLITNEYAFWNQGSPSAVTNPLWEMDSGSFFCNGHAGWTGVPNDTEPNAQSTSGNNSSVFRLNTKQSNFGNVAVSFDLLNQGLNSSNSTPPVDWDGLHIWLHYQTEYKLYYASINRRDNTVVIKKKVPGGPSNGGTYYELTPYVPHAVPYNTWQQVKATVQTNSNGTVTIQLFSGNTLLISATDNGTIGGPPITGAGKVGIRGDNANLKFKNFRVASLDNTQTPPSAPSAPTGLSTLSGANTVALRWNAVPGATSYNIYRSRFSNVSKTTGYKIASVTNPYVNTGITTTIYMVVTAVNAAGESVESVVVSGTPLSVARLDLPATISSFPNDLGDRRISPNPWKKSDHAGLPITFDHLTNGATVKIFTVAGQWIKTLSSATSSATWDLTNDSGEKVASGVYICLFTDDKGEHERNLLTVIQ